MIEWEHGEPRSWAAQLAEPSGSDIRQMIERLKDLPDAQKNFPAKTIGLHGNVAASAIVTLGPQATRGLLTPLLSLLDRATEEARRRFKIDPGTFGIGLISFRNVLECIDLALPEPTASAPVGDWLRALADNPKIVHPNERIGAALACLALGIREPVAALLGKKKLPAKWSPDREFYDDLTGYVAYVALALEQQRTAAEVEPAWRSVVWAFPTIRPKSLVSWNDLLWAARIHYHLFEKRPVGEVGAALYDFVRTL